MQENENIGFYESHVSQFLYLYYDSDFLMNYITINENEVEQYIINRFKSLGISKVISSENILYINKEGEILDDNLTSLVQDNIKMADYYAKVEKVNKILDYYREENVLLDDITYFLNSIRVICKDFGSKRTNFLLNNKPMSLFIRMKPSNIEEHLEFNSIFKNCITQFYSSFSYIRKNTNIKFYKFRFSLIKKHSEGIKDYKARKQYILSIQELLLSNIDIIKDSYIDFLQKAILTLTFKKTDYLPLLPEYIQNFEMEAYSENFTRNSLNYKLMNLVNEYDKNIDFSFEDGNNETSKLETSLNKNLTPFHWKGTELQLIELVHLLIESKILHHNFPDANKANHGKKAAYKAIFDFFNKEMKNDPTSRVREITSKNKSIKSQKVGTTTKPIEHNFQGLHEIISDYLKNYIEKPQ